MTVRSALPASTHHAPDDLTAEELAALRPYLSQIEQARADQREALRWLAEHTETAP